MDPATTARKHLSADALFRLLRSEFKAIPEQRSEPEIALADALMAGFAVFSLKHPSLLAFEHERQTNEFNLKGIFGLKRVPCDTQMRSILDDVEPQQLRPAFRSIFRQLQRGKVLEPMVFWQGHYLIASDGTTYHASEQVHCPACLEKKSRNGVMTYYHQMLGLALVHPVSGARLDLRSDWPADLVPALQLVAGQVDPPDWLTYLGFHRGTDD